MLDLIRNFGGRYHGDKREVLSQDFLPEDVVDTDNNHVAWVQEELDSHAEQQLDAYEEHGSMAEDVQRSFLCLSKQLEGNLAAFH